MKLFTKLFTAILLLGLFNSVKLNAQVTLTPMAGYTFDETFDVDGGSAHVSDGFTYGGILGFIVNPHYTLELTYSRQEAIGKYNYYGYYGNISDNNIPISINYMQIGGCRLQPLGASGKAEGFGGMNVGAVLVAPSENSYTDAWRFAVGFKLGVNIWASDKIGIRLQSNLQMPVQYFGGSIYVGTGGSGVGVSAVSTITQFGFTGGLIYKIDK